MTTIPRENFPKYQYGAPCKEIWQWMVVEVLMREREEEDWEEDEQLEPEEKIRNSQEKG